MCVIRALSLTVITVSALIGMSPTKALIKSSHKHWVRIKGSQQELVEKVCCVFYVLFFRLSVQQLFTGISFILYLTLRKKKKPLVIIS